MGGLLVTLGTAYAVSQKKLTVSTALVLPLIGLGVTYVVYGGKFKSKANEYKAMAGR